jgi:hypothetical protein
MQLGGVQSGIRWKYAVLVREWAVIALGRLRSLGAR